MKKFNITDAPIKVYGIPFFEEHKRFRRLPDEVIEKVPSLSFLGKRCPGARFAFKTDSKTLTIRTVYESLSPDAGMSRFSCQSFSVMQGKQSESRFIGLITPPDYETKSFERSVELSGEMEDVTVFFPRNEIVTSVEIMIDDDAGISESAPYQYTKPVVFYGSSITESGHSGNIINGYNAILSRHLDFDYINLGFSGSAKGELEMADYINTLDMSVFVYDYDHNADTVADLERTHEPFFKRIREKNPELPVLMMTRPKAEYGEDERLRREVVKRTYENAVAAGDKNVWFIDGETFYGEADRQLCSTDGTHPNDLGFYRMAAVIEPVLNEMLEKI